MKVATERRAFGHKVHRSRIVKAWITTSVVTFFTFVVFVSPAAAGETVVGPCHFRLDYPHVSSEVLNEFGWLVMRVHTTYYCTSELATVEAEVLLRFCGPERLPAEACAVVGGDLETDTHVTGINYGSSYPSGDPFTTSDSDPYPQHGWYVATAFYEICIFGGGSISGADTSGYAEYIGTSKLSFARDTGEATEEQVIDELPP